MPPKKLRGTEITSAQGQEMTRKVRARWSQSVQTVPARNQGRGGSTASRTVGIRNRASAAYTTQGV